MRALSGRLRSTPVMLDAGGGVFNRSTADCHGWIQTVHRERCAEQLEPKATDVFHTFPKSSSERWALRWSQGQNRKAPIRDRTHTEERQALSSQAGQARALRTRTSSTEHSNATHLTPHLCVPNRETTKKIATVPPKSRQPLPRNLSPKSTSNDEAPTSRKPHEPTTPAANHNPKPAEKPACTKRRLTSAPMPTNRATKLT